MQKLSQDILKIIGVLNKYKVEFLIVGGVGAVLHGSNISTKDIDVCPKNDHENFTRLSNALKELGARLRGAEGIDIPIVPELLENIQISTWSTVFGDLDVILNIPSGINGELLRYSELYVNQVDIPFVGIVMHVASLKDIIASKRFVARPKDLAVLPELEKLLKRKNQE